MTSIVFESASGRLREVEAKVGLSLMAVAQAAGVPDILGDCGGELSCATCHVYIDEALRGVIAPPTQAELDLIEDGVAEPRPNSRLSCQITVTDELEGMRFIVPAPF